MAKEHEPISMEEEPAVSSSEQEKSSEETSSPEEIQKNSGESLPPEESSAAVPPQSPETEEPSGNRKASALSPGQPKILVVDDTSISRVILRNLLTRMGAVVVEASNGQEALWQIEKSDPDLVITDLSMPVMDGFTMMDKAQNGKGDAIPVIVVSVYADKERLVRAVRLGAVDYIVKPFEQETVIKKVTNALKNIGSNKTGLQPPG